jgi:hypothetical protein
MLGRIVAQAYKPGCCFSILDREGGGLVPLYKLTLGVEGGGGAVFL